MKKKFLPIMIGLGVLVGSASVIYSQSSVSPSLADKIKAGFDAIQASLNEQKAKTDAPLLVEGEGIRIDAERFIFYKKNLELIHSLQKGPMLTDSQIIDEMIKKELAVQYAKKLGFKVSPQEIDEVVRFERESLKNADSDSDFVKELMKNRIRITGMTEDEFWNSDLVRNHYEESLLIAKLASHIAEGKINGITNLNEFQNELLASSKNKLKINTAALR